MRVALRSGFPVPRDGLLATLWDADAELIGTCEGPLPLHPSLFGARLPKSRREIPVLIDPFASFVVVGHLVLRFRLTQCRSLVLPLKSGFGVLRHAVTLVIHQREPELRQGVSGIGSLADNLCRARMVASLETLTRLIVESAPGVIQALPQEPGGHNDVHGNRSRCGRRSGY